MFFLKHEHGLAALKAQELADGYKEKLDANPHLKAAEKAVLEPLGTTDRVLSEDVLPGYMRKLTGGYEYRTYWFEIFECLRKVLLVGVPATFSDRGGDIQLVWGLLVCFITFGGYMLLAPYVKDSDDQMAQLSQVQIFLTLVASTALRLNPDSSLGTLVTVLFFIIPLFAIFMETPLVEELRGAYRMLSKFFPTKEKVKAGARRLSTISATYAPREMAVAPEPTHARSPRVQDPDDADTPTEAYSKADEGAA